MQYKHHNLTIFCLMISALTVLLGIAQANRADNYYASAIGLDGHQLRVAVHEIIVNQEVFPYSSERFDVHDAINFLDETSTAPDRVQLIYSDATAAKDDWPGYNREHVWPVSLGAAHSTPAYTDLHHIFACDANVNSARSNKPFDECTGDCNSHRESPDSFFSARAWEPPDHQKGDVARALFYMDVRYEGDFADEPDLRLVEWGVEAGCNCMGRLSRLRQWHELDPVDDRERLRNERVFELQGNRNPFVDHPEWVAAIFDADDDLPNFDFSIFDPSEVQPWINEFHYENSGDDANEGIEIAGKAGTRLVGWTLILYNGRDGRVYAEVGLEGRIDDEGLGFGALWFDIPNLQNGGADGFALIDPNGRVVEFLSYEGTLRAVDGPAVKMRSVDVGCVETTQSLAITSIQKQGIGIDGSSFSWTNTLSSRGRLNQNQVILRGIRFPHIIFDAPIRFPIIQ
ncbi:MAG: endonuclease [Myxococcota bacterium]|nr:endonuclease [Myxococcota bacterium]